MQRLHRRTGDDTVETTDSGSGPHISISGDGVVHVRSADLLKSPVVREQLEAFQEMFEASRSGRTPGKEIA